MGIILQPFAWLLLFFYNLFSSYGVALILFAIVIKLILFPVTLKSKKSMIQTTMLSEQMQKLQKQYGKDRERYNLEVQKLYEKEHVNPMGGCLWSLIPMFVLIALYGIIREPLTYFMSMSMEQIETLAAELDWPAVALANGWLNQGTLEKLQEQRVDAVIQMGGRVDDLVSNLEYVELVNAMPERIPMVINGKLDGTQCFQVQIDARKTMDLLMEHLIGLGHREIALVGGRADVLSTFEKIQRYKQLLKQNQIPFRPELVQEAGHYNDAGAYAEMNRMLDAGIVPTAVIAINDYSAAGIARSLTEHGYRIPEDISLVSYDNTYIAEMLIPKLTSIDYDYGNLGRKLVETAIGALEGKEIPKLQMLEPTLVVRESSGPARAL